MLPMHVLSRISDGFIHRIRDPEFKAVIRMTAHEFKNYKFNESGIAEGCGKLAIG